MKKKEGRQWKGKKGREGCAQNPAALIDEVSGSQRGTGEGLAGVLEVPAPEACRTRSCLAVT